MIFYILVLDFENPYQHNPLNLESMKLLMIKLINEQIQTIMDKFFQVIYYKTSKSKIHNLIQIELSNKF